MKLILLTSSLLLSLNSLAVVNVQQYFNSYKESEEVTLQSSLSDDFQFWKQGHDLHLSYLDLIIEGEERFEDFAVDTIGSKIKFTSRNNDSVGFEISEQSKLAYSKEILRSAQKGTLTLSLRGKPLSRSSSLEYFNRFALCFMQEISAETLPSVFEVLKESSCANAGKIGILGQIDFNLLGEKRDAVEYRKVFKFCQIRDRRREKIFRDSFEELGWIDGVISRKELSHLCKEKFLETVFNAPTKRVHVQKNDIYYPLYQKYYSVASNSATSLYEFVIRFLKGQDRVIKLSTSINDLVDVSLPRKLYLGENVRDIDQLIKAAYLRKSYFRSLSNLEQTLLGNKLRELLRESCVEKRRTSLEDDLKSEENREELDFARIKENVRLIRIKKATYEQCLLDNQDLSDEDEDEDEDQDQDEDELNKSPRHRRNQKECTPLTSKDEYILSQGVYRPSYKEVDLSCLDSVNINHFTRLSLDGENYIWVK